MEFERNNSEHCGCGGCGDNGQTQHSCRRHGGSEEIVISQLDVDFLRRLAETPFLPLARFILKRGDSGRPGFVALAPVYMDDKDATMETVVSNGNILTGLRDKGLITLDYGEPLQGGGYSHFENSGLLDFFRDMVAEGNSILGFDTAELEPGSIALTNVGRALIDHIGSHPFDTVEFEV